MVMTIKLPIIAPNLLRISSYGCHRALKTLMS